MKLFADDQVFEKLEDGSFIRCPSKLYPGENRDTWILFENGNNLVSFIKLYAESISAISFDNDLGEGNIEGYQLLDLLEEETFAGRLNLFHVDIRVHSWNVNTRPKMAAAIKNIKRFSERNSDGPNRPK
jgi:hypothetical protein